LRAKKINDGCGPTISAGMGMGGANMTTPMLSVECYVKTARPKFKGDCETYADTGVAPTVNTFDQGGKRANPHSGFHKEEIAKTLDTTGPNPTKNQGGNVIIGTYAFEPGIAKRDGSDSRFSKDVSGTLRSNMGDNQTAVAVAENIIGRADHTGGNGVGAQEEIAYTQNATGVMGVCTSTVRRLLPIECERLMGFPDNWTRIPWKGKPEEDCPDSPRYKACGNSMCVNVMRWIGEQIQKVEAMCEE
jgi:site-specific DNA-cytosine methylase